MNNTMIKQPTANGLAIKSNKTGRAADSFLKEIVKNKYIYLMALPGLLFYLIFCYGPMYGAIIAFKDYSPAAGILGSAWVGLENFKQFFTGMYFVRTLRNTILLSVYQIIFGFPAPILLALLLNEIQSKYFKRTVQTITYIPHFVSLIVISGLIIDFTMQNGIINDIIALFGFERSNLLMRPEMFRRIYVISVIWQEIGWGSIVYLAALGSIDSSLYEAARIDGAGRIRQAWHVTLPGIMPTIVVLFIMQIGKVMSVGFEKVMLLYSPATYETADIISTFVYRKGIEEANYSFSSAVGLFNSVVNLILIFAANTFSRKINETSLW